MEENRDYENFAEQPMPACFICFWGRHEKCRFMRPEFGEVKMPADCPQFEPYPDDWNEDLF